MKKLLYAIVLLLFWLLPLQAMAQSGTSISDAVSAGTLSVSQGFTDNQTYNAGFSNGSYQMYYTFTIANSGTVNVSLCGSNTDTYVSLLDIFGNELYSNDDNGPLCTGTASSIAVSLGAGTYYVVSSTFDSFTSGSVITGITTDAAAPPPPPPPPPGYNFFLPIDAGQFGVCTGTNFTDSRNNGPGSGYVNQTGITSEPSNDVFYSFQVISSTTMNVSMCGSNFPGYLHLYKLTGDALGFGAYTLITAGSDGPFCPGTNASIQQYLSPGYYVVDAEGLGTNYGDISMSIYANPNTAPPPLGRDFAHPITAGTITPSTPFSNSFTPTDCYQTNSVGGISCYYQFTLATAGEVSISNCGSAGNATMLQLINKNGQVFATDNMEGPLCSGYQASIKTGLPADTYYVTVGAFGYDASITTTISVAAPNSLSPLDGLNVTCSPLVTGLPASQNYLLTYSPRIPLTDLSSVSGYTTCDIAQTIAYVDGLGRPVQTVQVNGSPDGTKDVIQPIAYDQFGREPVKYLPYNDVANHGLYRPAALGDAAGVYLNSDQYNFYARPDQNYQMNLAPYTGTLFEASPENRPLEQGAPGIPWQLTGTVSPSGEATGHTVKAVYTINNNTNFAAKKFGVGIDATTGLPTLLDQDTYDPGQLYLTLTKNENWATGQTDARLNTTEEYKDRDGHVVLKRTYNYNTGISPAVFEILSTYYVYDDLGNLVFVLPPKTEADGGLNSAANAATINNLCYQYNYDERQRMIGKRIPGKDWEFTVYNAYDQVVATQDGNQRQHNQWTITKYDALGRGIVTGLWDNGNTPISQAALRTAVYGQAGRYENKDNSQTYGYTLNNTYPTSLNTVLSVNYYDSYDLPGGNPYLYANDSQVNGMPGAASTMTQGQPTATRITVLNTIANTTPDMLWSVMYYDDKGRVIQTKAQHYLGGTVNPGNYDQVSTGYDFTGEVLQTVRKHYTAGGALTIANTFDYDHMGRKRRSWEKINNQDNIITAQLEYNEIGQLYQKNLHGLTSSNGVSGTSITLGTPDAMASGTRNVTATQVIALNPGFSVSGGATFSAKIASFLQTITYTYNERGWLTSSNTDGNLFNFSLNYNAPGTGITPQFNGNISAMVYNVNKPTAATRQFSYGYDALNRLTNAVSANGQLDEAMVYDKMGNIMGLNRSGNSAAALSYNYLDVNNNYSNQLTGVQNSGSAFRNYNYDQNGNATSDGAAKSINYNLLNLPQSVTNSVNNATLATYTYEAGGTKLRNVGSDGTWDYINGIVYQNNAISFIQNEEGRASYKTSDGSFQYEYNLKDHLGNTRVSFDKGPDGAARVIQEDEYYAFGLRKQGGYDLSNNNRYLYNGKEIQTDLTDQYDYGARFYDPVIARWTTIDPKAELDRKWSPYVYGFNDPIRFTDPDGMWPDCDACTTFLKAAYAEAKQIFSGSASAEAKAWGVGGGAKVGPIKLKGEVNVLVGSVKVENKTIKLEGSLANAKGEAGFGGAKAKAGVDLVKGSVEVPLNKEPIKADLKLADGSASASGGKLTLNNSLELGASGKVGPVEVEGTIHLDHAAAAAGNLYKAAEAYIKDQADHIMHPQNYLPPGVQK